jgi:hypothetical protein
VGEADVQLDRRSAQGRAVADALDLEPLLESLRDAFDHVRDQRSRQPVQRAILAALGRSRDDDLTVVLLDLHPWRNGLRELPEWAVHHHASRGDRDVHAAWNFDWLFADATHVLTKRSR